MIMDQKKSILYFILYLFVWDTFVRDSSVYQRASKQANKH